MRASRRWSLVALALALTLVSSACSDDEGDVVDEPTATASPTEDATQEPTEEPTDTAAEPTITVEPSSGLSDGQTVTVIGEGFTPGISLGINQCGDQSDPDQGIEQTGGQHCNLQGIMPVQADDQGRVEAEFTVSGGPFGEAQVVCDAEHDCVISLGELRAAADAERATTKITFG